MIRSKIIFILTLPFFILLLLFLGEFIYFNEIYQKVVLSPSQSYDLVLMYGGSGRPERAADLSVHGKAPILISGDKVDILNPYKKLFPSINYSVDPRPKTTDQNARYSAPFIREKGFKRIALLTDWFHAPRAFFLTQIYLSGSGVEIIPCVNDPIPPRWWTYPRAKRELYKFWGSLGRIAFHFLGIDNWPPHEWSPGRPLYPATPLS